MIVKNLLDENQQNICKNFGSAHWLSSKKNVYQFFEWNTFFRRNPQIFVREYLGIKMHWYQSILIYLMFVSDFIVVIAARAAAKSFVIAIYSVARAILYPNSKIILTSGTRGQSRLIVSEKIQQELWEKSAMLRREIKEIKAHQNEVKVTFKNGSTIETVTCSDNALGHRSTVNVGEEAKTIDKTILDRVISPFKIARQVDFIKLSPYKDDKQFKEEPSEILISSSIEETHWLYSQAKLARDGMFNEDGSFFIAFDYSISLKHGIRTRKQMKLERKKQDPITWMVEYENAVFRTNTKAFFTYDMIKECQTLRRPFYPRLNEDVRSNKKNKYDIPKQAGEIRIVACDIATINRTANDNSVYSCLRLFPESNKEGKIESVKIQLSYLEAYRGGEIKKQAIRIRQLEADFDADYIVLDLRNAGIAIYDTLARVLYDDERCCEYSPSKCMNDKIIAERICSSNAKENIFTINASAKLNSDIAVNFRSMLTEHEIELLIPKEQGLLEIQKYNPNYLKINDPEERLYYEKPYLETMSLISELINLQYEKAENTGLIKIKEVVGAMKDRYSSVSYGCYFASKLIRDLANQVEDVDLLNAKICVSTL